MIKLYDSHITNILPDVLAKDPKTQALSYALNRAMQRLIEYCQNISVYATIDTLPEQILDLLAVELNTQYYDDSLKVEIKRNLIKNTLKWYMTTGTLAAVEEAVATVFGNGEVKEWFDYGGEPYHFKIYTSTMNSTDEMIQQIINIVSSVQNVRSQLEEVVVEVMQKTPIYFGSVVEVVGDSTTIGIDMSTDMSAYANKTILLLDESTGKVYSLSVVDGKLTINDSLTASSEETKYFILLLDESTGKVYSLSVVDGKLTINDSLTASSEETKYFILLLDESTGKVYSLSVVDGKLTMV